jgi:hypothetical protein
VQVVRSDVGCNGNLDTTARPSACQSFTTSGVFGRHPWPHRGVRRLLSVVAHSWVEHAFGNDVDGMCGECAY